MPYEVKFSQAVLGDQVGQDGDLTGFAFGHGDAGPTFKVEVNVRAADKVVNLPADPTNDSAILTALYQNGSEAFSGNIWSLSAFIEFLQAVKAEQLKRVGS